MDGGNSKARMGESSVSIVTPVYNGAKYLPQCIESVLAQTYQNWEYVIVNNCSSDESLSVAHHYARREPRIRIHNNTEFREAIANWNHALRQVSPLSVYCKIVHSDDWMFPECLARMVELAEQNPSVAVVGSYRLIGTRVGNNGIAYNERVLSGREICGRQLRGEADVFGNPSAVLFRSEYIRLRERLYEEQSNIKVGQDIQVCMELLKGADFGFIHQVLSFSREHDESLTSRTATLSTLYPESLHLLRRYGPIYMSEKECQARWTNLMAEYRHFLMKSLLLSRGPEFWTYHRRQLSSVGVPLSWWRLLRNAGEELLTLAREVMGRFLSRKRRASRSAYLRSTSDAPFPF